MEKNNRTILFILFGKIREKMNSKIDIIKGQVLKNLSIVLHKQKQMERHDKKVYLDLNHVFGSNCDLALQNSISFIEQDDKTKLVYTAGKAIIKKDIYTNQMQFIKLSDNIKSIQCMSVSPTRNHIAICEKIMNQNFILLNLYGLKSRDSEIKHFKLPQTEKQSTFKIIAFAPSQPKYACCLTGEPDFQLIFLDISRSRGLAVSNFPVENATSIAISPTQSHTITCAGKNLFRFYKVEDYSFKSCQQVKKLPKNRIFTAHSWFDKTKILLGTERGELFMIGPVGNNYEVKRNFAHVFSQHIFDLSVTSIGVFNRGFILGSNKGHFSLWMKKQENEENFQDEYAGDLVNRWRVSSGRASTVVCIAVCPKDENIAVGFENNNIALLKLDNFINAADQDRGQKQCDEAFDFLYSGFHEAPISSMDVCLHRPIIATMSKIEKTIKLWNYKKPSCELTKRFDSKLDGIDDLSSSDFLMSLSIHPFGYYLAVGFCDKLRIYHILAAELRNYKEIVLRGVCQLKFSNGGNFLAAAYSKQKYNIHLINVYNSYKMEEIARLSDHSNIITELCWKPDDKALYSVGVDGFVTEWRVDVRPENKEWGCRKWSQNNAKYTSVVFEKSSKSILVCGVESNKSVIREYRLEKQQAHKLYTMGFRITKLQWLTSQWNINAIIAGTDEGCLKVFNSPFDNIVEQTLNVHLKELSKIHVSPCGRYVFSVGDDSNIFVYQVSLTNREGFISKRLHDQVNQYELNPLVGVLDDDLAEIVLIQRNYVNQKIRYIKLLEKNLEDMKNRIVMEDDDNSRKHQSYLSKLEGKLNEQIDHLSAEYDRLKKQKKDLELKVHTDFIDTQGTNTRTLEDLEALFEKKLASENENYFRLEASYEKLKVEQEIERKETENMIKNSLNQFKADFVETFKRAQKVHQQKQQQIVDGQKMFNEKVSQIEQEHEDELKRINKKITIIGDQKDSKTVEYVTTMQSYNREIAMLKDQTVDLMTTNDRLNKFIGDLRRELSLIQDEIEKKQNQLKQKQQSMKIREERIGIFQEQIGDLQKKKQILSYRTWEMRQEMEPKEDEIQFLKEQIYNLEKQFENLLTDEKSLNKAEMTIKKQKQKISKRIRQYKASIKEKQSKLKKIYDDISVIVESKSSDKKYYEAKINQLYEEYAGAMTDMGRMNSNTRGIEEMGRHMTHLKKQISDTNQKAIQGMGQRDNELRKATVQNKNLIQELKDLREGKLKLNDDLKNSVKISENLKRQINQLRNASTLTRKESSYKFQSNKKMPNNLAPMPVQNAVIRSSSQPLKRGKLVKGKNYDTQKVIEFSKNKIQELEEKLEILKMEQRKSCLVLEAMKTQIKEHIEQERCSDPILEKTLYDFEL